MTTEHAPAAEPAPPSPADGSAIPHDEPMRAGGGGRPIEPHADIELYHHNPAAWAAASAPRWIPLLDAADDERVLFLWRAARIELKRAVWALASDDLKTRIRTITEENPGNEQ